MAATDAGHLIGATGADTPQRLPRLRQDLDIQPGPRNHLGQPTWTLHDGLRGRFFQLGERAFQLLSCWAPVTPAELQARVEARYPWRPTEGDIQDLVQFLVASELFEAEGTVAREQYQRVARSRHVSLFSTLIHNYLFFRVPLIRPDRLLDWLYPRVGWLLTGRFLAIMGMIGLVGLAGVARQWDSFAGTIPWFFSTEGMIVFGATLVVVKVLHEFGHALTCRKFGLRVPSMGVTFLVMWPVLYTDATEGWRLRSRWQRALISSAGVITELVLACVALALWLVVPDGFLRGVFFTVATTTLVMSLLVNLNPLMRFDGYYFLSDVLNVPNLQDRSFELGRWHLRKMLFGGNTPPPEHVGQRLQRILVTYAYLVWVYRFFLFLGIALLVYHMFFKALGIFLFLVEIWFFILRPILREIVDWQAAVAGMSAGRRRLWMSGGAAVVLVLLFPWRQEFTAGAQSIDASYSRVYAVRPALVEEIVVREGSRVQAGDVVVRLRAPEVEHELQVVSLDVARLRSALAGSQVDSRRAGAMMVLQEQLSRAESRRIALLAESEKLLVRAPVAGRVRDLAPNLLAGQMVPNGAHLMTVVSGEGLRVTALVPEDKVHGLEVGDTAAFHAESGAGLRVPLRIETIETAALTQLESPYDASVYGGAVPAEIKDNQQLVPSVAVYRVVLAPTSAYEMPEARLRGWVHFSGQRRTLLGSLVRVVVGGVIRESGL